MSSWILHDRYLLLSVSTVLLGLVLLVSQFGPLHLQDVSGAPSETEVELLCFLDDYRATESGVVANLVDMSGNRLHAFIPEGIEVPEGEVLCYARGSLSEDGGMLFVSSIEVLQRC